MTSETRPVCVYAMAGLNKNTTKLMVVICIGIALALYGVYVQARSQSNPTYMPSMSVATSWLYETVGHRIGHPGFLNSCRNKPTYRPSAGHYIMHGFVYPVTRYSGIFNGFINLIQIVLLKVYCKSFSGSDAIIGLSSIGIVVSMICLVGSFATCKLMCISCLGIHHVVIIYLAMRRRKILKNILCPVANTNEGSCSFSNTSNTARSSSAPQQQPKPSVARRSQDSTQDQLRRRSGRAI